MSVFKPMLAGKLTKPENLRFPVIASPKLDGIRCLTMLNQPWTRNMKQVPNKTVREMLSGLPNMDGELIVGDPTAPEVFQRTSSGIMSAEGTPDFKFFVFDILNLRDPPIAFRQRTELAEQWAAACGPHVQYLPHTEIRDLDQLEEFECTMLMQGFEGVMVRCPNGPYKQGRSTEREGWLLKVKRFEDSEAEIIGFVERMHNANELQRDELGRAKRSSHKANKRPTGTLGALMVRDIHNGVEFEIGTGFDDETRQKIWEDKSLYEGMVVTYSHQPVGAKDKPRFPVFMRFRTDYD